MMTLFPDTDQLKVLCLGAHCDDIEIGCGGTLLKLKEIYPNLDVHWVIFSSSPERRKEAEHGASLFLDGISARTVSINQFRNAYFPSEWCKIKEYFSELHLNLNPDLILTHYHKDLHQDHRVISELTSNAFRNHLILEYEIMKYDGDMGSPSIFIELDKSQRDEKIDNLLRVYDSQRAKHWFTRDAFEALMRLRGIECNSKSGFAEAFYCRKLRIF